MFMEAPAISENTEKRQGVFSVVFKFEGEGDLSSLMEEADYSLNHLLIADTQVVNVCEIKNTVTVSLYMECDVTEEEAQDIANNLDYSFFRDEEELTMEVVEIDFS